MFDMRSLPLYTILLQGLVDAQQCSPTLTANYPAPSVAQGFLTRLVANNLTLPRDIKFDSRGALLILEEGVGISALNLVDAGQNCLSVGSRKVVVKEPSLNHGLEISQDGSVLYASSKDTLWSWKYSAESQSNTSAAAALVTGMDGSFHPSRTIRLSKWAPGMIVINRDCDANVDPGAANIDTGRSQVKAFNITDLSKPWDFNTDGLLLGWGLRNDVGIAEEPTTGAIYSVENGADKLTRDGQDIHENNPAEELNFLGYLNGTKSSNQGRNFGYPECHTAWYNEDLPNFNGNTGDQFAIGASPNDTDCSAAERQVARLSFQAHTSPLDILFNDAGTAAWVTFHGSSMRDQKDGYYLGVIPFANGEPVASRTSRDAVAPVMSNQNVTACPDKCFRPVGLAWDSTGRLFMSSDTTGEIYAIVRTDDKSTMSVGSNATGTIPQQSGSATTSAPAQTTSPGSASSMGASALAVIFAVLAYLL